MNTQKKYYWTLATRDQASGVWGVAFGDYDRDVVEQEKIDSYADQKCKVFPTLAADEQAGIDDKIQLLNERELAKSQERVIVASLVEEVIDHGVSVTVFDGEENAISRSRNARDVLAAMFSTDGDVLILHSMISGEVVAQIRLEYGNGCDVVCDYSERADQYFPNTDTLADTMRDSTAPMFNEIKTLRAKWIRANTGIAS